jgi:hypothetical protein
VANLDRLLELVEDACTIDQIKGMLRGARQQERET